MIEVSGPVVIGSNSVLTPHALAFLADLQSTFGARREEAEEAGRAPSPVIRAITRMPRRLGYHLGPE